MELIKVYSYRRCPFAMRVRLLLHEKGIKFDIVEENLKHFSEELLKLHPEAKVPVLVHGHTVVYESAIITEYIEDTFPSIKLMPVDPKERAEVRLWTYWCNQLFKPDLDRFKYGESRFTKSECFGIEDKMLKHLEKLESALSLSEWLVGRSYTLADIHVFPFIRQLTKIKPTPVFLSQFKKTNAWCANISARDAFIKTMQ